MTLVGINSFCIWGNRLREVRRLSKASVAEIQAQDCSDLSIFLESYPQWISYLSIRWDSGDLQSRVPLNHIPHPFASQLLLIQVGFFAMLCVPISLHLLSSVSLGGPFWENSSLFLQAWWSKNRHWHQTDLGSKLDIVACCRVSWTGCFASLSIVSSVVGGNTRARSWSYQETRLREGYSCFWPQVFLEFCDLLQWPFRENSLFYLIWFKLDFCLLPSQTKANWKTFD